MAPSEDPPTKCCGCAKPIRPGRIVYHEEITGEPMCTDCWMRDNEY
jgi:hypothetical protein